ncbi:MAG TPA: PC4/YdbC family ssDNA-binding protein [bacterium]|nr:PC4/YdbC family ssDNA-binding protein [bacterium]HQL63045.1 PC4/YdbC family ssDNA-binding protein [bacterium]
MDRKILITTFGREPGKEIRLFAWHHRGRRYMDLRTWILIGDKWTPTKSGVTFREHEFSRLSGGVKLASDLPAKVA